MLDQQVVSFQTQKPRLILIIQRISKDQELNTKITNILINVKEASDKIVELECRININNTQRISKNEELNTKITNYETLFNEKNYRIKD